LVRYLGWLINLDECEKSGLVFENAIASVEIVNCKSVEVQVTGKVPSFAIDKTSGIQLYLSQSSLESEIVTAKSDQMNVLIPTGDDLTELAIPEQYKTVVSNGKLVTHTSSHV
jgi:adenylyl cyclase-associated protein